MTTATLTSRLIIEEGPDGRAEEVGVRDLAARLDAHRPDARVVLGIAGPPGAGKSTLAALLVDAVNELRPGVAVQVPMDGFHLARSAIAGDDRATRRGAPDTFDPAGYAHLLQRLRARDEPVVHAPEFRREVDDPVAGAIAVTRETRVVVTEGNYLLLPDPAWTPVRARLDAVWYLDAPDSEARVGHLVARHVRFGKTVDQAQAHVLGTDETNAVLVARSRSAADLRLRWASWDAVG